MHCSPSATTVCDGAILKDPCNIPGAGSKPAKERPWRAITSPRRSPHEMTRRLITAAKGADDRAMPHAQTVIGYLQEDSR